MFTPGGGGNNPFASGSASPFGGGPSSKQQRGRLKRVRDDETTTPGGLFGMPATLPPPTTATSTSSTGGFSFANPTGASGVAFGIRPMPPPPAAAISVQNPFAPPAPSITNPFAAATSSSSNPFSAPSTSTGEGTREIGNPFSLARTTDTASVAAPSGLFSVAKSAATTTAPSTGGSLFPVSVPAAATSSGPFSMNKPPASASGSAGSLTFVKPDDKTTASTGGLFSTGRPDVTATASTTSSSLFPPTTTKPFSFTFARPEDSATTTTTTATMSASSSSIFGRPSTVLQESGGAAPVATGTSRGGGGGPFSLSRPTTVVTSAASGGPFSLSRPPISSTAPSGGGGPFSLNRAEVSAAPSASSGPFSFTKSSAEAAATSSNPFAKSTSGEASGGRGRFALPKAAETNTQSVAPVFSKSSTVFAKPAVAEADASAASTKPVANVFARPSTGGILGRLGARARLAATAPDVAGGDERQAEAKALQSAEQPKPVKATSFKIRSKPGVSKLSTSSSRRFSPTPPVGAGGRDEAAEGGAVEGSSGPQQKESEEQLMAIMRRQALTDQDRFEVLDARDKYFRLRGLHRLGGTVLKGLCPDICPEKERYSRAAKNQLRVYEKREDTGGPNHKAVVKEYSRSSADQDIPLPHELRPSQVLARALDHVLYNVIDRVDHIGTSIDAWYEGVEAGDPNPFQRAPPRADGGGSENVGDWFEYVWSVTRGVRKDITQQQLNRDLTAVGLVEKCCRFHIMCCERLVEEGEHNFSRKLNDENLTKCLQTLKHMYEDMREDGMHCQNEPEFRAYEVLMNLNDGDILRSIQTAEQWVQDSPDVKLSLEVFMALNSNNYVRFFKLVRKASLLQGCILLRYFYQVRSHAVSVLIRAYTQKQNQVVKYSLARVSSFLGFEDVQSCGAFFSLHGIRYDVNSDSLLLSRSAFYHPEELPEMRRAQNLIESKRRVAWSTVINGGEPLPPANPYLSYTPHDSFDSDGFLKSSAYEATDQHERVAPMSPQDRADRERELARMRQEAQERSLAAQEEHRQRQERQYRAAAAAQEILTEITDEVVEEEVDDAVRRVLRQAEVKEACQETADSIVAELTKPMLKSVAAEAIREARNAELQARLEEEARSAAADEASEELLAEFLGDLLRETAREVVQREARLEKASQEVTEGITAQVLAAELDKVAREVIELARIERQRKIDEFVRSRRLRLQLRALRAWSDFAVRRRRAREALLRFPSGCAGGDVTEQNARLRTPSGMNLDPKRRLGATKTGELFRKADLADRLAERFALEPLDLTSLAFDKLSASLRVETGQLPLVVRWKLLVCLPMVDAGRDEFSGDHLICQMVKKKFSRPHGAADRDPDLLCCYNSRVGDQVFVACVRCVDTRVLEEEVATSAKRRRSLLWGTSAVLFLRLNRETDEQARSRMDSLVRHLPNCPVVPIQVLTTDHSAGTGDVLRSLGVESRIGAATGVIPESVFAPGASPAVARAVARLAEDSPAGRMPPREVEFRPLRDLAAEFVAEKVLAEFQLNLAERRRKGLPHQDPALLLRCYNACLDHLAAALTRRELRDLSWPIPEIESKRDNRNLGSTFSPGVSNVSWGTPPQSPPPTPPASAAMKSSDLFRPSEGEVPEYWNDPAHLDLVAECVDRLHLPEELKTSQGYAEAWEDQLDSVYGYLSRQVLRGRTGRPDGSHLSARVRERLDKAERRFERRGEPVRLVPWTDVVQLFVDHRLSWTDYEDRFAAAGRDGEEMVVGVYRSDLEDFRLPAEWYRSLGAIPDAADLHNLEKTVCEIERSRTGRDDRFKRPRSPSLQVTLTEDMASELDRSARFEANLRKMLSASDGNIKENLAAAANNASAAVASYYFARDTPFATAATGSLASLAYAPVVSCLSPSLAAVSSSAGPQFRLRKGGAAGWRRRARPYDSELKASTSDSLPPVAVGAEMARLKAKVEEDLDESYFFERRLRAALEESQF